MGKMSFHLQEKSICFRRVCLGQNVGLGTLDPFIGLQGKWWPMGTRRAAEIYGL